MSDHTTPFPKLAADWDKLAALDEATLDRNLVSVFTTQEAAPEGIEFDRLMSLGAGLAKCGRGGTDRVTLQWLAAQPSARRLDIASGFLCGTWNSGSNQQAPSAEAVTAFVRLRGLIPHEDDAAYSSAVALIQVVDSKAATDVKQAAAAALRSALTETYEDAAFGEQARQTIAAALSRAG